MKAFVTGADGLLGGNLVRMLLDRGLEVTAFVHPASRSRTLDELDINRAKGDILDEKSVENAMSGNDFVFHVAASTALWPPRDKKITAINVEGTRNVVKAVERNSVKKLIHVGSASSFGYGTKERPGNEETPYAYRGFGLAYFDSKLEAQSHVLKCVRENGLNAVVVAPTFMIGPYDSGPSSGKMIAKYAEMKLPFYPSGGRNFVHVRDAAAGMISAVENGKAGECYILGNRNMDMKEFFTEVARVAGFKPPIFQIPREIMLVSGLAGSIFGAATGKQPEITLEMARSSSIGCYYSAAKAVCELNMPQTPVEIAVEDAYKWLKDNGCINRA
ncbi:MAG TPA: NAD-dependent epimerase/dehydratase family protein [bacterium]|nr:NAD-dependent epimerase/dehydratase family protein [bacterium]